MSTSAVKPVLIDYCASRRALSNVVTVASGAVIIGLLAQVSVPLWPVPVTGQTLGVLLVGAAFGFRRGGAAMATYALLGLAGVPWFANFTGGPAALLSPSFGFIIGFIPAAMLLGYLSERGWDRRPRLSVVAFSASSVIPFLVGVPYLWLVLHFVFGETLSFVQLIDYGVTPFIIGGVIKGLSCTLLLPAAWAILHKIGK